MTQPHVTEEMYGGATVAKFGEQAPLRRNHEFTSGFLTVGERREHPLDAAKQAAVRDVENGHCC
jgi:hypothetical protein